MPFIFFAANLIFIGILILFSCRISNQRCPNNSVFASRAIGMNAFQNPPVFDRREDQESFHLTYGWADFNGHSHNLSFFLLKRLIDEAEEEFGYFPADLKKHLDDSLERSQEKMIKDLRGFVQDLILKSKYPEYILIEKVTAKSFNLKLSVPPNMHKKVKREFEKIKTKMTKEQEKHPKRIEKEQEEEKVLFLEHRGLRVLDGKIGVNHGLCVMRNKDRIKPILEIMQENFKRLSLHEFLGLLLSFIQDIRFYIPPLHEKGKVILSFWVPPRVLADNFGDCDSKGVTFASLWANFKKYPILLITVPRHFFLGLGIPSFAGEGLVVNGVKFTLCEVTGPGKMPPGMISRYSQACLQNGQYVYELIN
jgi:hypothetical protein